MRTDTEARKLLQQVIDTVLVYAAPVSAFDMVCVFCGAPEWEGQHYDGCILERIKDYLEHEANHAD